MDEGQLHCCLETTILAAAFTLVTIYVKLLSKNAFGRKLTVKQALKAHQILDWAGSVKVSQLMITVE